MSLPTLTDRRKKNTKRTTSPIRKQGFRASYDSEVVNQNLVLRLEFSGENRHLRKAAKRFCNINADEMWMKTNCEKRFCLKNEDIQPCIWSYNFQLYWGNNPVDLWYKLANNFK